MLLCIVFHGDCFVKVGVNIFLLRITDLESGSVREQVFHSDRFVKRVIKLKSLHIRLKIGLQIYLPLLHQLHDGCCRKCFGDGGYAKSRTLRVDRRLALLIGIAVAFLCQDFAIFDDNNGSTDILCLGFSRIKKRVQKCLR
ncbi:hypothetical protein D3C76_1264150 [compost metagenome]